ILLIDNYDSFTYNLADILQRFSAVSIYRNDQISLEEVESLQPHGIVISPGPGRPENAGISLEIVTHFHKRLPILGVCLGHQIIGQVLGAEVIHAIEPMHGKTSWIHHESKSIFKDLPNPLKVMRYHSLILATHTLPETIEVTATTIDKEIMGIQHKIHNLTGVQFHPESILSLEGIKMVKNWTDSVWT
ncbi:UNVERIFIED_CONTAM: hypothetical protein GTU68_042468, partial [Idotea baltica]|nr:hypothetical protein [Idotea baltica]